MMYKNITDNLSITTTSPIRNKCDSYLCWFFLLLFFFHTKGVIWIKEISNICFYFVFVLFQNLYSFEYYKQASIIKREILI
jgi:hypothetical protein